jgi:hypothetical protein
MANTYAKHYIATRAPIFKNINVKKNYQQIKVEQKRYKLVWANRTIKK